MFYVWLIYTTQMYSHASDLPIRVLVPAPRVCELFEAGAVRPEQVEDVQTQTKYKSVSGSTVVVDLDIVWNQVPTDPPYYELRILKDNSTSSEPYVHTELTVRTTSLVIVSQTERYILGQQNYYLN